MSFFDILLENFLSFGILQWIGFILIYFIVVTVLRMIFLLLINRHVSSHALRYSQPFRGGKKILVLGDSIAVGAGAEKPELSIAGRLGHDLPTCEIRNLATNGARTVDVIKQLEQIKNETFDLIIICVGGNDIFQFTPVQSLQKPLILLTDEANRLSGNQTIFLVYSNIAFAPLFPGYFRRFLQNRNEKILSLFMHITGERGAFAIDCSLRWNLHETKKGSLRYFAADKLHPSALAYQQWYKKIWKYIAKDNLTCDIADRPTYALQEKS